MSGVGDVAAAGAALRARIARRGDADVARFDDALSLATSVHDGQVRPDGAPYALHVIEVASQLLDWCDDPPTDVLIAALLHDAVEDQAHRLAGREVPGDADTDRSDAIAALADRVGAAVARRVAALTNPLLVAGLDRAERDARYAEHVGHVIASDPWVAAIKLSDWSTNGLRLEQVDDRARRARLRAKYAPVADRFGALLTDLPDDHPLARIAGERIAAIDLAYGAARGA